MPAQQAEFTHQDEGDGENNPDHAKPEQHISTDAVNHEGQEV
jgi:hypothetical protein